jgi:hypothetical protein
MGLFSDIGLGGFGDTLDSGFNGVFDGASDLFNSSIDLTKNVSKAGGTIATNLASFLDPQTFKILLYVGGAIILYKVVKN